LKKEAAQNGMFFTTLPFVKLIATALNTRLVLGSLAHMRNVAHSDFCYKKNIPNAGHSQTSGMNRSMKTESFI